MKSNKLLKENNSQNFESGNCHLLVCRSVRKAGGIMSKNNKAAGLLRFIVETHDGEESVVVVFKNESDNTYSFVNLTNERIYSNRFNTVEEAIQNMNDQVRKGLIVSYTVKGNHPELGMDEIGQIIK